MCYAINIDFSKPTKKERKTMNINPRAGPNVLEGSPREPEVHSGKDQGEIMFQPRSDGQ